MKNTIFKGAGVALVTPFTENGINYDEFARLIDFQIENETDAIIVGGTTGEPSTMPHDEHVEAIKFAVEHTKKRVPVIAGTGSNDTEYGIKLSREAERIGADALLLVTPYYNKCTQKGLVEHYKKIAGSVNIPSIVYSVPSRTGVNILPKTALELSKIDNIVAIKEASGDISQVAQIAALVEDRLDIYSGNDDQIVPIMSLGGIGVISVLSNVMPKYVHDLTMAYLSGDVEKARRMQLDVCELNGALFCEVNPIPVKTALGMMGYNVGPLRLPLCEMMPENKERLHKALASHGLV